MKKLYNILLLALCASFVLTSCNKDDDSVTPTTTVTGKYFNMKLGSYWTYTDYDLNTDGSINQQTLSYDSIAVTGTKTLLNKTAFDVSSYNAPANGTYTHDMDYAYSFTDNQLYVTSSFLNFKDQLPIPIDFELPTDQWLLIADNSAAAAWNVFATPVVIPEQTINFGGTPLTLKGTYQIIMSKKETGKMTINGTEKNTVTFEMKHQLKATISILPVEINVLQYYTYADGVGLVKSNMPNQKISINLGITSKDFDVPGFESTIKTYSNTAK